MITFGCRERLQKLANNITSKNVLSRKNRQITFFRIIAFSPAIYGYLAIASIVLAAIGGMLDLGKRRALQIVAPADWILISPGLIYFFLLAISLIRPDFELADFSYLERPLIFIILYFLLVHFRTSGDTDFILVFMKFVPIGALFLVPYIIYQAWYLDVRLTAGARNPIPLAIISLVMSQISLLYLLSSDRRQQFLGLFGFLLYALAVIYSQTRSIQIIFLPCLLFTLCVIYRQNSHNKKLLLFVVLLTLVSLPILLSSNSVMSRFIALSDSINNMLIDETTSNTSLSQRVEMLQRGFCIAKMRPLSGYGVANRRDLLNSSHEKSKGDLKECYGSPLPWYYNHFHNGYITATIDVGVFGAVSILLLIISPLCYTLVVHNEQYRAHRIVISTTLAIAYGIESVTGQPFGGDLLDAFYVMLCMILSLSNQPHCPSNSSQVFHLRP